MKKTMKTKVVLALLMSGAVCMSGIYGVQAQDITINGNEKYSEVNLTGDGNTVTISGVTQNSDRVIAGDGSDNLVKVTDSYFKQVYGAKNEDDPAVSNTVTIDGDSKIITVMGAYSETGTVAENTVNLLDSCNVYGTAYGGASEDGNAEKNQVNVYGGTIEVVIGGEGNGRNSAALNNVVTVFQSQAKINVIYGGRGVYEACHNEVHIDGGTVNEVTGGFAQYQTASNNKVYITNGIVHVVCGGNLEWGQNNNGFAEGNEIILSGGSVNGTVYGAYTSADSVSLSENTVTLTGTADVKAAELYGADAKNISAVEMKDNKLIVDGWQGATRSINNFNSVDFTNILWKGGGTILSITEGKENALNNAAVNVTETNGVKLQGGQQLHAGETMTLIESNAALGTIAGLNDDGKKEFTTTAGVAAEVQGSIAQPSGTEVTMTIQTVDLADQTMIVAENRAVAAAFVNQGTDLISDSLDTLSHDGRYGTKTFAAVYGNRSKYDVNSDLKINGWSTIVGVGNTHKVKDGDLSWGVFYENGTGNYRTYNSFNNEFFRGDGSLLYNGGGAAVRYNRDNGWYYEGSLRAGTLKSDMDNALMDGEGNHYGYSSESNYYGAHIGVGKVFSLSADRELDVYGKFFHTYTDGDSFDVAGDRFEFDDITSDRLRVGARIRTNPEERVSTYYGLAYEYEFNGEADMRAAGLDAPTQSLQGSTCMAELGLKYQPSETSPWNFDLNVRGYAGEREGGSFHAQVSYLF